MNPVAAQGCSRRLSGVQSLQIVESLRKPKEGPGSGRAPHAVRQPVIWRGKCRASLGRGRTDARRTFLVIPPRQVRAMMAPKCDLSDLELKRLREQLYALAEILLDFHARGVRAEPTGTPPELVSRTPCSDGPSANGRAAMIQRPGSRFPNLWNGLCGNKRAHRRLRFDGQQEAPRRLARRRIPQPGSCRPRLAAAAKHAATMKVRRARP